jgi:predicted DNA-binding transcriptional regulator
VLFYVVLTLFVPSWLGFFGINTVEAVQFWLIAVPVFVGFMGILIIGAWIGWTMATTPPPKPIEEITTDRRKESRTDSGSMR